ncbi:MAG TPA: hypothetical protein VKX24_03350 [Acidimicrobiia bacterium]|nr:hypothetical protein [Acidimicrobiia bacterium]HZQ77434.1 hypothetical protein [Acidimicrobiia bacterium]
MATALITGSRHRTALLDGPLRAHGDDVLVADSRDGIAALAARLPARSVGAYVQLLMDADAGPSWAPPVTERIETVALVAPLLAPEAAVVLVADDPADPAHDPRVADGLCLLAEAALSGAESAGVVRVSGVRVSVLPEASAEAISRMLGHEAVVTGPLADLGADRDYADWRTDILSLTSCGDATYFGWLNQDGRPRIGRLRGSVLSPLAVGPDDAAGLWGRADAGAEALGRALIADTLGGQPVDDGLVAGFAKDVIGSLPAGGFELSAGEVRRWLRDQLGRPPATA